MLPFPTRLFLAALPVLAFPAFAQAPGEIALSPADRAAAIDVGAARAGDDLPVNGQPRQIHGEVGMAIGTGGYRSLYGSTIVPFGQTGIAAFSFETGQGPTLRRR